MTFQFWFHVLLSDAASRNRSHVVARLGQQVLRQLYDQGAQPSIEAILKHYERKHASKVAKGSYEDGQDSQRTLARAG
jgi:hypothetical protein